MIEGHVWINTCMHIKSVNVGVHQRKSVQPLNVGRRRPPSPLVWVTEISRRFSSDGTAPEQKAVTSAVGHRTDMPTLLSDVRCWVNSGKHLLAASISPFDPLRACCTADTPGKQTPLTLCARLTRLLNSVRCARIELFTAVFWRMNNGNHSSDTLRRWDRGDGVVR